MGQEKIPGEGLVLEVTGVIPCENRGKEKQMGKDTKHILQQRVWERTHAQQSLVLSNE